MATNAKATNVFIKKRIELDAQSFFTLSGGE